MKSINIKFFPLFLFFLFGNMSCNKMQCFDCNPQNPEYDEMQIEAYIDGDNFKGSNVAHCSYPSNLKRTDKKTEAVDGLKARMHQWGGEIEFETDIFLQEKEASDTESGLKVIIYIYPHFRDSGQILKIIRLNDKGEETHILAELKGDHFPPPSFDCKKRAFVFPAKDENSIK